VRYLTLVEALLIAEAVTGIEAGTLAKASRIELLDSALHSPRAGFGDEEFYPDLIDKAAGSRRSDRSLSLGSAHREDQPVRPPHGLLSVACSWNLMSSRSLPMYHTYVVRLNSAESKSHRDDQPSSR
jgi:hypothetical protein